MIYSLNTYTIVKEINEPMKEHSHQEDDSVLVTCIQSNHKIMALVHREIRKIS